MALSPMERVKKFGKLYVQNMMTNPEATVICHFRVPGRHDPHVLKIPPGPYPYPVYPSRLPESAIMEGSDELIRFIDSGVLKVIPGKPARKILSDPDVRAEVKAMFNRANSDRETRRWAREQKAISDAQNTLDEPMGDRTVTTGAVTANPNEYVQGPRQGPRTSMMPMSPLQQLMQGMNQPSMAPSRAAHQLAIAGGDEGVNPKVLGLMASFMPERDLETVRKLKSMRSMLTVKDFNMIIGRAGVGSQVGMWAQRQMESLARGR